LNIREQVLSLPFSHNFGSLSSLRAAEGKRKRKRKEKEAGIPFQSIQKSFHVFHLSLQTFKKVLKVQVTLVQKFVFCSKA